MRIILSGIFLCLALFATAAISAPQKNNDEIKQVQEQIQVLGNSVTILKEVTNTRLDAQDRRIGDLGIATNQQANYMGAISNLSSMVGMGVTVIIAIIAFIAGLAVYFSAKTRAVVEAREAVQQWFKENSDEHDVQMNLLQEQANALQSQISVLQQKAIDAHREIDRKRSMNPTFKVTTCPRRGASYFSTCGT